MRDAGNPDITIHLRPGTAAEVKQNLEDLRCAAKWICGEATGCQIKTTIDWNSLHTAGVDEASAGAVPEGGEENDRHAVQKV
ncbi:hypothetical protein FL966_05260 [Caproiciproducens galactitolivorans]|uniref:hypothetical protein n=2 Tax=Caproiciproducens galactitolivorans TaxID=642589 RepID=UPI0010824A1E|nr:hypothetical protein [Caproiciproducens galactitolivorans]QEY34503.1 hypothetical protein FL966_05260 [Caproiciproducens galactitolivorans]